MQDVFARQRPPEVSGAVAIWLASEGFSASAHPAPSPAMELRPERIVRLVEWGLTRVKQWNELQSSSIFCNIVQKD
jgi:hypothetical protein